MDCIGEKFICILCSHLASSLADCLQNPPYQEVAQRVPAILCRSLEGRHSPGPSLPTSSGIPPHTSDFRNTPLIITSTGPQPFSLAHALAAMSQLPSPVHTSDEAETLEPVLPSQKTIAFAISVVKSKPPELSIEGADERIMVNLLSH